MAEADHTNHDPHSLPGSGLLAGADEVVHTLAVQPFVRVGSDLLLAQRNADGTCAPGGARVSGGAGSGEAVEADAMVPFWTAVPSAADPDKMVQAGGYAVSKEGITQLRLFNTAGDGTFGETLAEVPARCCRLRNMRRIKIRWRFTCCAKRLAGGTYTSTMH